MGLKGYFSKRNFNKTPEPRGKIGSKNKDLIFVVQEHHARHLHYDFRLEFGGTLKSWAVPKGPSLNPKDKRLAVQVEDHPLDYAQFEGEIPKGEYGAGQVSIWDSGTWIPPKNTLAALKKGHLDFELKGEKLRGHWSLIRMKRSDKANNWLLFKRHDQIDKPTKIKKLRAAPLPDFIEPQLAQPVKKPPQTENWIHEIKYDGYRTLCYIDKKKIRFFSRSGQDWTAKYPSIAKAAQQLKAKNTILDGEIVWINEKGHSDFQLLQNALSEADTSGIAYYVFDILFLNGQDLREQPLLQRKKTLAELFKSVEENSPLILSQHWANNGSAVYQKSCNLGLEGIVSKDAHAPYRSGRSLIWQKTKCSLRQEFVIIGYTKSLDDNRFLGALLLGAYDDQDKLNYVGRVGTGFSRKTLEKLQSRFRKLAIIRSPLATDRLKEKSIHWLKPLLVAEIEFKAWTRDGVLRQASFQGLREDKKAKEIHIELPQDQEKIPDKPVPITHPKRIVYSRTKTTKLEILQYYQTVAPLLLPFTTDRPLAILRCQENTSGTCYFQKHSDGSKLIGIDSKKVHYKDKKDTALVIRDEGDLTKLVQAGTVEIHSWNGQFSQITRPDQIIFDLDPDSLRIWPQVIKTAHEIHSMLDILELESFVKVTGGKGLHIHVPVEPRYSWDQIKAFSKSLMEILANKHPEHYTTRMTKKKRSGRIFLDYLRNGYGATAIVPYSLRARELPTVALPITWKEVKNSLSPDQFVLPQVLKLIEKRDDPWRDYWSSRRLIKAFESQSPA